MRLRDGEGHCACGCAMASDLIGFGLRGSGGASPARVSALRPQAMRGARMGVMRGLGFACAVRTSASSRSCATMRAYGQLGAWSEGPSAADGGGALRMRLRDGLGVLGLWAVRVGRGQRRLGFRHCAGGRCGMRSVRGEGYQARMYWGPTA